MAHDDGMSRRPGGPQHTKQQTGPAARVRSTPDGGARPDATIRDAPRSGTNLSETPIVFLRMKGRSISQRGSPEFPLPRENFGLPRPPRDIPMPHHFPRCHQNPKHDRSYVPEKILKKSSTIPLTRSKVTTIHGERTTPTHPKHTTPIPLRILHPCQAIRINPKTTDGIVLTDFSIGTPARNPFRSFSDRFNSRHGGEDVRAWDRPRPAGSRCRGARRFR